MSTNFVKFYELDKLHLDGLIRRMKWSLWDKQEEICIHKEGHKYPVLAENAYDVIAKVFDEEVYNLRYDVCMAFLDHYYRNIIDPGDNRKELEEHFGWEYPDWEDDLSQEVYFEHNHERMIRPAFISF